MRRHGVRDDVVKVLAAVTRAHRGWGGSAPVTRRLRDGGELEFASRRFASTTGRATRRRTRSCSIPPPAS